MSYLFGYGSIINAASRNTTGQTGQSYPATVAGLGRAWNSPIPNEPVTALGIIEKKGLKCNGVLVEVTGEEIKSFDQRETGYNRRLINPQNIDQSTLPGKIWIYINKKSQRPTKKKPIIQSYLDVVLAGCLTYGRQFALDFINTTQYWDSDWFNDRDHPRYPRAMVNKQNIFQTIDNMLRQAIPQEFAKRKNI